MPEFFKPMIMSFLNEKDRSRDIHRTLFYITPKDFSASFMFLGIKICILSRFLHQFLIDGIHLIIHIDIK